MENLYTDILSIMLGSDGRIIDIKPYKNEDWSTTNIYVSNEWNLLEEEKQIIIANSIGGDIKTSIKDNEMSRDPKIKFTMSQMMLWRRIIMVLK